MNHHHSDSDNIKLAFFMNLGFTILEIVGGLWTNSLAILSDSLHDFGDSISLGLAWYLGRYAEREEDERYSYGYRRYSLLAALINTVVLITGSLFILSEAIPRLLNPEQTNARGMILFAIVGILVNGLAALRVRGGASLNVQVVAWHLFEDVLGWVAVLIVSLALLFTDIYILDPILSVLITIYVLVNMVRNMRRTLALFLQAVPEDVDLDEIVARIRYLGMVESTHHTHAWSLDGEHHVLTTHVVMREDATREDVNYVKEEVREIAEDMNFVHTTVEIEFCDDDCKLPFGTRKRYGSLRKV